MINRSHLAGILCAACLAGPAAGDVLLDTGTPGGFLGYVGFDIYPEQSIAVGFIPTQDYTLDDISLWIMSNDFENPGRVMTVSVQTDVSGGPTPTAPSGTVLESWDHATAAVGWQPVLETLTSTSNPVLSAGTTYWVVAESDEPVFFDPLWVQAGNGPLYWMGILNSASGPDWSVGETGGPPGIIITGTPVPEPGMIAMATLGAALVAAVALRRK